MKDKMHSIDTNVYKGFNSLLATYLMGCEMANDQMTHRIFDLCWVDEGMLIVADNRGGQLVKYNMNITNKTCEVALLDYVPYVYSISLSGEGQVLVSANSGKEEVKIMIYDVMTGQKHMWNTGFYRKGGFVSNAESRDFIVLSLNNETYIFSKNQNLLHKVTYNKDFSHFMQSYTTDGGMFFGATSPYGKPIIMNLLTNEKIVNKKGIAQARGVSGSRNGYVYVTATNGADVGVYSPDGTFLNYLQMNTQEARGGFYFIGALKTSDNEDLIAFSTWNDKMPVAIYKIDDQNSFDQ